MSVRVREPGIDQLCVALLLRFVLCVQARVPRSCVESQPFAFEDGVGDAGTELVPAGEQCGAGRGAGGADVKIGEAHALVVQPIEVGRFEDGISVTGEIAVTLIIREDEDDIWPRRALSAANQDQTEQQSRVQFSTG